MSYIIVVDLTIEKIEKYESECHDYGRGLAVQLLIEHTPEKCPRLGRENVFVIAPGLFTGAPVVCANRATIVARDDVSGIAVGSITGDLPQKLASLQIAAIIIKGKSETGDAVLYVDEDKMELHHMPDLHGRECGTVVDIIRRRWGADSAVIGCGSAADMCLPISSMLATYPEGEPRFSCPSSSFGDVPASKGLRAIVICHKKYFGTWCSDRDKLQCESRKLARYIVEDPICGGALPGLGSITLLHLLKNKENIPQILSQKPQSDVKRGENGHKKVNYCCAPMCVIGCLNKHSKGENHLYSAPDESEVRAAVERCFQDVFSVEEIDDCASLLTCQGMKLGINITEFVYTVSLYLEAIHETPSVENIQELMEELRQGTTLGRVLGGGTVKVSQLFCDNEEVQNMVTRPAVQKENEYSLKMDRTVDKSIEELSDLEVLYREIFLFENLGICIFSSFALLDKSETLRILANLYTYKTGRQITVGELLEYSGKCLRVEDELTRSTRRQATIRSIPEFVKVLYRYFEHTDECGRS